MNHEPDEYALALRAREGDREALAELVERTRLRLFALAYAELRHYEDAHDAVASALLQVCRHITELREPERVRAWMQSIVRNEVRRIRRTAGASPLSLGEADGPTEDLLPSLARLDIERALRRLPGDQERAIRLFYLTGLSIPEIARLAGSSNGTVKSWLHRGRQRLALEMEGYAPMPASQTPPQTAAVIHTDLDPALLQKITDTLRAGGYTPKVLTTGDPSLKAHLKPRPATETPLSLAELKAKKMALALELLKEYQLIVLDETVGGHSAFEFLMHLRAHPETKEIPVCVLCSDPTDFTVSAYFTSGVNRLANKNNPDDLARIAVPYEKPEAGLWALFTERARRVIFFAQEEAASLGENFVGTEHLLLGLIRVPDSVGAQILLRFGIALESVREAIFEQATRGSGVKGQDMQLTPRAKKVIDFAYDEAQQLQNNYIGVEHLLLGMLREGEGLAARVLTKLGADLERTRQEIRAMQGG
jgi:RNA polymerase sigma factor (sigma-70 family)